MAFPTVSDITETSVLNSPQEEFDLPATVDSGDLLLAVIASDEFGTFTATPPTGWTEIARSNETGVVGYIIAKVADGTEDGGTVTLTTGTGTDPIAAQCYRIKNWFGAIGGVEAAASAYAAASTVDPPSLTPTWGAADTLWIAAMVAGDDNATVSAYPSNYTNGVDTVAGDAINFSCSCGTARRELNASSENPGTFTLSELEGVVGYTIAVRPAAGGGGGTPYYSGMSLMGVGV